VCGYADCTITSDMQMKYIDYLMDEQDSTGRQVFGWIEKDGNYALGATSASERVYVGDTVDTNVQITVNPCFAWSVALVLFIVKLTCLLSDPGRI